MHVNNNTVTPPLEKKPQGLRERGRQERFARIIAAAEEVFAEKAFDEVTTREVAQRAQVGEATLFRYVAHKTDLLLLVIGRRQEKLIDQIEQADDLTAATPTAEMTGQWFIERIEQVYRARIGFYMLDPEYVANYVSIGFQCESALGANSIVSGDRIISRIQHILEAGQSVGVLRDDVKANIVARNLNGAYIHEVLRTPARHLPVDETWQRLEERLDAMLRPLLTAPAR